MNKKFFSAILPAIVAASLVFTGCGAKPAASAPASNAQEKTKIIIGTSSVSVDLAQSGVEALEEMGYEVEIKVFDDYFLPNQALVEGTLDANFYQHKPFLDSYNQEKGTKIQMLEPALWNFWAGIYSTKADSIANLPNGGKAGIASDASNTSEDLKRLQKAGLIKLTDEKKDLYDIADIVENPHNLEFTQADGTKYKNQEDYTLIIGTSNTMAAAGVDPTKNLLESFVDDSLALGMCIAPENADKQWVKDLMKAYTSDKAKAAVAPSTGFKSVF